MPGRGYFVNQRFAGVERGIVEINVLMDGHGTVTAVARSRQPEFVCLARVRKFLLFIAGINPFALRAYPDLEQVSRSVRGMIEFAVRDSAAGAHTLDFTGHNHGAVSHAVLMRQRALQDVGDDFHVLMVMGRESLPGRYPVFIDNAKSPETHMRGVPVFGKGKSVVSLKPAVVKMAAVLGFPDLNHALILVIPPEEFQPV